MVVLTVFTLWITPESSDSNKSCVLYMTMSTFAAGLALWEGYKNVFIQPFSKQSLVFGNSFGNIPNQIPIFRLIKSNFQHFLTIL